jgi:hypothetical protein
MAAPGIAGRGYNLLTVIVSHHTLHGAATYFYRQENISVLFFTISVENFVG